MGVDTIMRPARDETKYSRVSSTYEAGQEERQGEVESRVRIGAVLMSDLVEDSFHDCLGQVARVN